MATFTRAGGPLTGALCARSVDPSLIWKLFGIKPCLIALQTRSRRLEPLGRWLIIFIASLWAGVVTAEAPPIELAYVPNAPVQQGGPDYDFRVARFEVRNDQFVAFLNDAMGNPDDERGAYLFFDTTTGDVYLNGSSLGGSGPDAGNRIVKIFSPAVAHQIDLMDGTYQVVDHSVDFAAHPVSGVSWFGAVKFCNWMTIVSGLPASERVYAEGPGSNPANWRPVSVTSSAWATRDLSDAERRSIVAKYGYRLPMDQAADEKDTYNEWFKYASAREDATGIVFDAAYGFGRAQLTNADANYIASGDPFEQGTTPVGFFDGFMLLADGVSTTSDTENAYGLYDVSGNVWEWVQDQSAADPSQRRNRGGSWRSGAPAVRNNLGSSRTATATVDSTGFRIVQSVHNDLLVVPFEGLSVSGPWGGPYGEEAVTSKTYRIENVVDRVIDVVVGTSASWLSIEPTGGMVAPGDRLNVQVAIAPSCDPPVPVGAHDATIWFREQGGAVLVTRTAQLNVTEPLRLTPTDRFTQTRPFGDASPSPSKIYTLENRSATGVSWSVTWEETTPGTGIPWLTINGEDEASGVLEPGQAIPVTIQLAPLEAARLPVGVHEARLSFQDACTGTVLTRSAHVEVVAPFEVSPLDITQSTGPAGGPYHAPSHEYTLTNALDTPISWSVDVCADSDNTETCAAPDVGWLTHSPSSGDLIAKAESSITATINAAASTLTTGTHTLVIRFSQPSTGYAVDREVELTIAGLDVRPATAAMFSGLLGGPFAPAWSMYNIYNTGAKEFIWTATVSYDSGNTGGDSVEWLDVVPDFGLILDPFGSQAVRLSPSSVAAELRPGSHHATVTFSDGISESSRDVTLIVGDEGFRVNTILVSGRDAQSGGPTYDFRMGRYEVTNAEFVRFLNDAHRNRDNERGSYLYHDIDSSSVHIHDAFTGVIGTDAPGAPSSTMLYNGGVGRISYDPTRGEPYVIQSGYEHRPVVGVSWYGAVKFCNWLTLIQGMPHTSRVYGEGPNAAVWRAVSSDPTILGDFPSYRLPMDGRASGAAGANEWHKAASRRGVDSNDQPIFGSLYGFGRNALTRFDANYANNGDTAQNGTTPVGFFDGSQTMFDEGVTAANGNGYGFFDLTGNAAEWVHEVVGDPGVVPTGATRGGHYSLPASSTQLRNDVRVPLSADATFAFVGFRVAQRIAPVALEVDVGESHLAAVGPVGGPLDLNRFTITLRNDAEYTADDFDIVIGSPWLKVDGVVPTLVPPHGTIDVALILSNVADSLGVASHTNEVTVVDNIAESEATVEITLALTEPLVVDGPNETEWSAFYCDELSVLSATFTLTNESTKEMPWRVASSVNWLDITPPEDDALSGMIPGLVDGVPQSLSFAVETNEQSDILDIGEHRGVITFTNTRTGKSTERAIEFSIHSPLNFEPSDEPSLTFSLEWGQPVSTLDPIDATLSRCVMCGPACALEYRIDWDAAWLTIEPTDALINLVPVQGETVSITISVNKDAKSLAPGKHVGEITISLSDDATGASAGSMSYEIMFQVLDPIEIDTGETSWDVGCAVDLDDPPIRAIALTNNDASDEISVELSADAAWIDIEPSVLIRPGATEKVPVSLNEKASSVTGSHAVMFSATNTLTGHVQEWEWTVDLTGALCVTPFAGFDAYGASDGPMVPAFRLFRIHFDPEERGTIRWRVASDQPWIEIDGEPDASGRLSANGSYLVRVTIVEANLPALDAGIDERTLEAMVTFENVTEVQSTTRRVRLTQVRPPFVSNEQVVSALAHQPGGPTYSFIMGRTHVTNAEFVAFLNNAMRHPNDPLGQYMFFDTNSGDVYMNDVAMGVAGPDPGARFIPLFRPAIANAIEFVNGSYRIVRLPVDYSDHPVVGASWYGAVKYCNWLTLAQGFSPSERCYGEETDQNVSSWHPMGISPSHWATRDLNDGERESLLASCRGYRLPMDDGFNNANPLLDSADAYNEWYKAGAWDSVASRNRIYGFGRDSLTAADANFRCSGDPFEAPADCTHGDTTPVGYFDGSEKQAGATTFATTASANSFGLMDMTGNTYQWMQGRYAPSASIDRRALRGGGWDDPAGANALRMNHRTLWAPPATTNAQIGIRVVRVPARPSFDVDDNGMIDIVDLAYARACQYGPGTDPPAGCARADQDSDGDVDLQDVAISYAAFEPSIVTPEPTD